MESLIEVVNNFVCVENMETVNKKKLEESLLEANSNAKRYGLDVKVAFKPATSRQDFLEFVATLRNIS